MGIQSAFQLVDPNSPSGLSNCSGGSCPPKIPNATIDACDGNEDISTTLYFGNLHPFAQQQSLEDLCSYFGPIDSARFIKLKQQDGAGGYGFVKFVDKTSAEAALQALNGKDYLGQELRVNWALPNNHKEDTSHHCHVFVGDLASDVTDAILYNAFCTVGQCSDARVMWDHATGWSKGYGFVTYRRKEDAEAAIAKMQGKQVGSRRVRVGWAQHKQCDMALQLNPSPCSSPPNLLVDISCTQDENASQLDFETIDRADPANTNVYIGNIAPETRDADMLAHFSVHGPVAEVKLHKKGGYGFAKFEAHESAVKAIVAQHSRQLHGRVLKCSWGRNNSTSSRRSSNSASAAFNLAAALQNIVLSEPANLPALTASRSHSMMASLSAAATGLDSLNTNHVGMLAPALPTRSLSFSQAGAPNAHTLMSMPPLYSDLLDMSQGARLALSEPSNIISLGNNPMYHQIPQAPPALDAQMMLAMMMMLQSQDTLPAQSLQAPLPALNPAVMAAFNPVSMLAGNAGLEAPAMHRDALYGGMHGLGAGHGHLLL